jgi:glycyl-tRNA synthetase
MILVQVLASGKSNCFSLNLTKILSRYSRNDEIGTAFGVTVDFQSVQDRTLTLRERDTTKQVRASEEKIVEAIRNLCNGSETWDDVTKRLPAFEGQEVE